MRASGEGLPGISAGERENERQGRDQGCRAIGLLKCIPGMSLSRDVIGLSREVQDMPPPWGNKDGVKPTFFRKKWFDPGLSG